MNMGLSINLLAVLYALNENVGVESNYLYLRDAYRAHGGDPKQFGDNLDRAVRGWPGCVEYRNRVIAGGRIDVWVFVASELEVV